MVSRRLARTPTPDKVVSLRFAHRIPSIWREGRAYLTRQWDRQAILDTQRQRLTELLEYALSTVPAYRNLGLTPGAMAADPYAALQQFPFLHKHQIQQQMDEFATDEVDPSICFKVTTSGSTGVPLEMIHDEFSLIHDSAGYRRIAEIISLHPGDRVARVVSDRSRPMWRIDTDLFIGPMDVAVVNIMTPDQEWCRESLIRLDEWQPMGLFGNPSDLLALALLYESDRRTPPPLRFAVTGGENLTENARVIIERVLNLKVFNVYGMEEVSGIAWECEAGELHVDEDRVLLEAVPALNGDMELAVTPLCNLTMPLIRYRTGDLGHIATWETSPCPCGRKLSRLVDFVGRDRGFILLPGNRLYSPKPIKLYLTEQPLSTWQLIQRMKDHLEIRVVLRPEADAAVLDSIQKEVDRLVGGEIAVTVRSVKPEELLAGPRKFQMMHLTAFREAMRQIVE